MIKDNVVSSKIKSTTKTLLVILALLGTSCDSETVKDILGISKDDEAKFTFVNALNDVASLHLKHNYNNISNEDDKLFDNKYAIFDDITVNGISSSYTYEYNMFENGIYLGVRESISQTKKTSIDARLKNEREYWAVAWLLGVDYKLSLFKKTNSDQANVYKVRIFASSVMNIKINGSEQVVATTEKGKISETFAIDDCANGLEVGDNFIDLCSGDFGKSYLVVADESGKRVIAQE